jgi:predicted RNase H-like HicB family nuclease
MKVVHSASLVKDRPRWIFAEIDEACRKFMADPELMYIYEGRRKAQLDRKSMMGEAREDGKVEIAGNFKHLGVATDMRTHLFPAYFRRVDSGGYAVDFPDLPGCVSAGDDLEEALVLAREALSLHLFGMTEDGDSIPTPTDPAAIPAEYGAFVAPVEGRPDMVGDEIRNRSVKKTLTIPYWLNEAAERNHVNFSQVLQEALKDRVGA